jgi:hypothetical protein
MLSFVRRIFEPTCLVSRETPGGGPYIETTATLDDDETERTDRNVSNFFRSFYDDISANFVFKPKYEWIVAINFYFLVSGLFAAYISVKPFIDYEQAMTPNLPFCETPFAVTPYMAQGASAMAHLPYVPVLLLAIGSVSSETIPALDNRTNPRAHKIKQMLWIQTGLQTITSFGGHMLPNPRIVMNQETSIAIAFLLLYSFFDLTTSERSRWFVDFNAFVIFAFLSIFGYVWFGLMPVIFTVFAASLGMSYTVKGAFGLLTPYSKTTLLYIFVPTATVLAVETVACDWLLKNVSYLLPWHLLFDILFWQVLGSAIDVIVISPLPGRFMVNDKTE